MASAMSQAQCPSPKRAPRAAVALATLAAVSLVLLALPSSPLVRVAWAAAATPSCPSDLSHWRQLLGAQWLDCHQLPDLTTTNNPWTDAGSLTGMGQPPPGSGTLDSRYTTPTSPAVPGLQLDGYWPGGCNAYQSEPAATNKKGQPFIPGCTPSSPIATCVSGCHHDEAFVLRIPDSWNGHLVTAGTPGIRDQFASDFIFSDFVLEKGWAYISQDKGNMGANFYRDGAEETSGCTTPWCPAAAIQQWTTRMRQATVSARTLLDLVAPTYGLQHVTRSYAVGISNGGYQVRRALETDTGPSKLYDGGVDWEGTLFSNQENLFSYLPTSLAQYPGNGLGEPSAVQAMTAVGFNPESQPLWNYHWGVYWGLTQKVYRLELDPEYTGYTCADTSGVGPSCVSPPVQAVPANDPDAAYNYQARLSVLPALAGRMQSVANTGDIHAPLITLQGDQDSLLPIRTDADLYAKMVAAQGHAGIFRFYPVAGGNHVDPQFDDHSGVDSYGNNTLRPMLPCVHAAIDALDGWVQAGTQPPDSHTIARPQGASAQQLANQCSLASPAPTPPTDAPGNSTPLHGRAFSCAEPSGRLAGRSLGPVTLGMTRARVRSRFARVFTRGRRYMDFFCPRSGGIRVGYASPDWLRTLSGGAWRRLTGRVVLVLTSNRHYTLHGVRVGTSLASVPRRLRVGAAFPVGRNRWYLAPDGPSYGVLKVRHGVIEEVGIATAQLTGARRSAQLTAARRSALSFFKSFS